MLQFLTSLLAISSAILNIKEPAYKVIDKKDYLGKDYNRKNDYELRQYEQYTTATLHNIDNTSLGFRKLAGYIGVMGKPQNKQKKKMPMTKPVLSTQLKEGSKFDMSFVLPLNSNDQAPEPTDPDVHIEQVSQNMTTVASKRFRWRVTPKLAQQKIDELLKELISDKVYPEGTTLETLSYAVAQYNSPWMPGVFRRNEVWIAVPKKQKIELSE